ncbi:hypothetical protein LCGC14_0691690 [marine sediment metagenome]|uniref:Uncharacterized protein n=1 Tax=marine sediment metagenome TaxID=412755 RepID=A0A0F9QKB5_9ZZZZ
MPAFPRAIASRLSTPPEFPEGFASWGQSGKGQFRSFENVGRIWTEIYPSWNYLTTEGRALIRAINLARRELTIWTIQHPHLIANYGAQGGSPLVDGASQAGDTILIDGAPASTLNWLRDGDIILIAGSTLILDVKADVDTDSAGDATIPIHPPIFTGGSPSNNAVVTIDASAINFTAVLVGTQMPDIEAHGVVAAGMTLTWREQPS